MGSRSKNIKTKIEALVCAFAIVAITFACTGIVPANSAWADTQYNPDPYDGGTTNINIQTLQHEVTLNPGVGTGEDIIELVNDGGTFTVPSCTFTHESKRFTHWSTNSDGSGTTYNPNDEITITEAKTLYAQWIDYDAVNMPITGLDTNSPLFSIGLFLLVVAVFTAASAGIRRIRENWRKD